MAATAEDTALSIGLIAGILGGLIGLAVLFVLLGKFCSCINWKKCKCARKKKEDKKEEEKKEEEKKEEEKKEEEKAAAAEEKKDSPPEEVKPEELEYRRPPTAAAAPVPIVAAVAIPGQVEQVGAPPPQKRDSLPPLKRLPKKGISFGNGFDTFVDDDLAPPPQYNLYEYEVNRPVEGLVGQFRFKSLREPQKFHYEEVKVHGYVKEAMDIV
ncbi:uncharacterized protein LOC135502171 [Lineus longissimus]|uniref:uncharacterized protein LOC135502171 n=1 Tax=Lineus longissimus TaxID=88925 RepID=UPI002B4E8C9F